MEEGILQQIGSWLWWVGTADSWLAGAVLLLAPAGLLWAPFAAVICGLLAHLRNLDRGAYAAAGARSSALLLLPFFYVLARMLGTSIPVAVVRGAYVVFYQAWLVWILVEFLLLGDALWDAATLGDERAVPRAVFMLVLSLFVVPLHIFFWVLSVRMLIERNKYADESLGDPDPILPASVYIQSFAWIFVGALMFGIYLMGGIFAAFAFTGP